MSENKLFVIVIVIIVIVKLTIKADPNTQNLDAPQLV